MPCYTYLVMNYNGSDLYAQGRTLKRCNSYITKRPDRNRLQLEVVRVTNHPGGRKTYMRKRGGKWRREIDIACMEGFNKTWPTKLIVDS